MMTSWIFTIENPITFTDMRRLKWIGVFLLFGSVLLAFSCGDNTEDESPAAPTGVFTISGEIGIRYYDAEGKDMVKFDDGSTWPVMARTEISADSILKLQKDSSSVKEKIIQYSGGRDMIVKDDNGSACLYQPNVWGDGTSSCDTYIHIGGEVDKITTVYSYILVDGRWYPRKQSVTYNGTLIWTRDVRYSEVAVTRVHGIPTVRIVSQTK